MNRKRINIFAKRLRKRSNKKNKDRKVRVKAARKKKTEEKVKYSENFYLNHPRDEMKCYKFAHDFCSKVLKCKMIHSEVDRKGHMAHDRYYKVKKYEERVKLVVKS